MGRRFLDVAGFIVPTTPRGVGPQRVRRGGRNRVGGSAPGVGSFLICFSPLFSRLVLCYQIDSNVIKNLSAVLEFASSTGKLAALGALQNLAIGCSSQRACNHGLGCRSFKVLPRPVRNALRAQKGPFGALCAQPAKRR